MLTWNVTPAPAATPSQQSNTLDQKLRQRLIALIKLHTDALDKNDAAAVAAAFTENGILVTPDGPIFGREAIEKYSTRRAFSTCKRLTNYTCSWNTKKQH